MLLPASVSGQSNSWALESEQLEREEGEEEGEGGREEEMGSGSSKGPRTRRGRGLAGRQAPERTVVVGSSGGTASPAAGAQEAMAFPAHQASPPSPDPDLELLEQVLEECGSGGGDDEEDVAFQRLRPSSSSHFPSSSCPSPPLLRLDAGDLLEWRPQDEVGGGCSNEVEEGATRPQEEEEKQELPQKAARATPESSNFANQVPPKDPDRLAKIAYDYSEEELMATIEQEYCR